MSFSGDVKMYGRFVFGLRRFLRETVTIEKAVETIRRHLAEREGNFLRVTDSSGPCVALRAAYKGVTVG